MTFYLNSRWFLISNLLGLSLRTLNLLPTLGILTHGVAVLRRPSHLPESETRVRWLWPTNTCFQRFTLRTGENPSMRSAQIQQQAPHQSHRATLLQHGLSRSKDLPRLGVAYLGFHRVREEWKHWCRGIPAEHFPIRTGFFASPSLSLNSVSDADARKLRLSLQLHHKATQRRWDLWVCQTRSTAMCGWVDWWRSLVHRSQRGCSVLLGSS